MVDGLSMQKLFSLSQHLIHIAEASLPLGFPAIKTAIFSSEYSVFFYRKQYSYFQLFTTEQQCL